MAVSIHGNNGFITTNGTAAAPSFAAPDNDTGLYFGTNLIHATTGGVNRFNIDASGRVGIGTTSPTQKLEVLGTTNLFGSGGASCQWGDTNYVGHLSYASDGAIVRAASGKALIFHTNHVSEKMRITSTGRVGINQASPEAMLQVDYDYANSEIGLRLRAASGSGTKTWQFSEINGNAAVLTIRNATNGYNILNIDGANQRVGINQASPDRTLHVNSASSNECALFESTDTEVTLEFKDTTGTASLKCRNDFRLNNSTGELLRIDTSGRLLIGRESAYAHVDADNLIVGNEATNEHQGITILSHSGKYGGLYFGDGHNPNGHNRCKIIYDHPNDALRIGTAGNAATQFYLNASGHMGLGISPSDVDSIGRSLNIASSTGGAIYLQDTDAPTSKFAAISYNGGTAALQIHAHHSSSYIDLGTNGTPRLRIDSTGKVLIGDGSTYSPSGLLHLVGDDNSNGPELYLQVGNNNTTDNIGAIWFGNNVDKSLVKLAGHTHTANNTADFSISTSNAGTLNERLRLSALNNGLTVYGNDNIFYGGVSGQNLNGDVTIRSVGSAVYQHIRFKSSDGTSQSQITGYGGGGILFRYSGTHVWAINSQGERLELTNTALGPRDTSTVLDLGTNTKEFRRAYVENAHPKIVTSSIIQSSSTNQSWYDTGFRRDSMGGLDTNGTYIITAFADTYNAGGGNYSCHYTWIVGMRDQSSNQNDYFVIPLLTVTGHSTNGQVLALRTIRQYAASGGSEWLQWKASNNFSSLDNSSSGRILRFSAQRIGRAYS